MLKTKLEFSRKAISNLHVFLIIDKSEKKILDPNTFFMSHRVSKIFFSLLSIL
jgi:hypothetical protein